MKLFTVYDSKARIYGKPFCAESSVEAIRSWMQICKSEDSQFAQFPDDFSLYEIGEYNNETAKISQSEPHHLSDVVRPKPAVQNVTALQ